MANLTVEQKNERSNLALEATWGIEACIQLLRKEMPYEVEHLALACLARRIQDLNSVIMSALGTDDNRETEEMRAVVRI